MFLTLSNSPPCSKSSEPEVLRLTRANLSALGFKVERRGFAFLVHSEVARFFINGHLVPVGEKKVISQGDVVTFVPCMTSVLLSRKDGHVETVAQKQTRFALLFDGWPIDAPPPWFSERVWPEDLFDALRDHALAPHYAGVRWSAPH